MPRIFISYRRADTKFATSAIHDRLAEVFHRDDIFMDLDDIRGGQDFRKAIENAVSGCDVFLPIIGEKWLSETDDHGRRRLDDPEDFVRLEIETALVRDIPIIPVLVEPAKMPVPEELPASIRQLSENQGALVRGEPDIARDIDKLADNICDRAKESSEKRWLPTCVMCVLLLLLAVSFVALASNWNLPLRSRYFVVGVDAGKGDLTKHVVTVFLGPQTLDYYRKNGKDLGDPLSGELDDLEELKKTWVNWRGVYRELFEKIGSANPSVLVADFVFEEPSPEHDAKLSAVLEEIARGGTRVVLGTRRFNNGDPLVAPEFAGLAERSKNVHFGLVHGNYSDSSEAIASEMLMVMERRDPEKTATHPSLSLVAAALFAEQPPDKIEFDRYRRSVATGEKEWKCFGIDIYQEALPAGPTLAEGLGKSEPSGDGSGQNLVTTGSVLIGVPRAWAIPSDEKRARWVLAESDEAERNRAFSNKIVVVGTRHDLDKHKVLSGLRVDDCWGVDLQAQAIRALISDLPPFRRLPVWGLLLACAVSGGAGIWIAGAKRRRKVKALAVQCNLAVAFVALQFAFALLLARFASVVWPLFSSLLCFGLGLVGTVGFYWVTRRLRRFGKLHWAGGR